MNLIEKYVFYLRNVRRYSDRTVSLYESALRDYADRTVGEEFSDSDLVSAMNVSEIRSYEAGMFEKEFSAKTVNLHLSALSGFCRFLMKEGAMASNPVRLVPKPKASKTLPVFFRKEAMEKYFERTSWVTDREEFGFFLANHDTASGKKSYEARLARLVISMLYGLGLRRAELIGITVGDVDFGRNVVKVHGKGDKMREIPLIVSLCEEILLYLEAVETICGGKRSLKEPLLVTFKGKKLYPVYVDRVVKSELGGDRSMTGRKSPHVLRHSLATDLLNGGADVNSIKELLGHSSLAATQIYTHGSIARLKTIYEQAHPRAKNGGKHGD